MGDLVPRITLHSGCHLGYQLPIVTEAAVNTSSLTGCKFPEDPANSGVRAFHLRSPSFPWWGSLPSSNIMDLNFKNFIYFRLILTTTFQQIISFTKQRPQPDIRSTLRRPCPRSDELTPRPCLRQPSNQNSTLSRPSFIQSLGYGGILDIP